MFVPRQTIGHPFLQQNPFLQFGTGAQYQIPVMLHPIQGTPGFNLLPIGVGLPWGNAINPLTASPFASPNAIGFGVQSPLVTPQIGALPINAIGGFALAGVNPLVPNPGLGTSGGQGGFGQPIQVNPAFGIGPGPFESQFVAGQGTADPVIQYLLAQQLNSAYQQLPVRPLISGNQFGPAQPFLSAGLAGGQITDPYLALVQAQLISQLAANPYQPLFRSYPGMS